MDKMPDRNLAKYLSQLGVVKTDGVYEAFSHVRREDFLPKNVKDYAYLDSALSIGYGQTNSQPYTVAFMLELLEVERGQKVLDVGSGSGWTTALLANLTGKKGNVIGVEVVPELVSLGSENLSKYNFPWAHIEEAGDIFGWPEKAPYDRILVSASAKEIPKALINQLANNGIMVIPVRESIWRIIKTNGKIEKEEYPGFLFVPLV